MEHFINFFATNKSDNLICELIDDFAIIIIIIEQSIISTCV